MPLSKQRLRIGVAGICVALFASACAGTPTEETSTGNTDASTTDETTEAPSSGGPGLPTLVANTVGGAQLDTNDLEGQDVVVWFWAPW